jgi:hypothetical protein
MIGMAWAAAKSLASDTGASVQRSVEETLHHPEVDAVLVVTSSDTHIDCILQAILAGKAVIHSEVRWSLSRHEDPRNLIWPDRCWAKSPSAF